MEEEVAHRILRLSQLYEALSKCNQAIVHSRSEEELLSIICRDVVEVGRLKMAWYGVVDEATFLHLQALWKNPGPPDSRCLVKSIPENSLQNAAAKRPREQDGQEFERIFNRFSHFKVVG